MQIDVFLLLLMMISVITFYDLGRPSVSKLDEISARDLRRNKNKLVVQLYTVHCTYMRGKFKHDLLLGFSSHSF